MKLRRPAQRAFALTAVSGLLVVGATVAAALANAAPTKNGNVTVSCDNGKTYTAYSPPGNGDFTPAIATDGTVLVPKAFGESFFEMTQDGVVIESGSEPPRVLGSAGTHNPRATVECSYAGSFSFEADGSVFVGSFSGTATVLIAAKGH